MTHFGVGSVAPPILAIALAVRTKNVITSLLAGLVVGLVILHHGNPAAALDAFLRDFVYAQAADADNAQSLANMFIIGGFVAMITASGGARAFAAYVSGTINSKVRAESAAWLSGIAIFFSDTANALLLGPIFLPIADRLKVSREKLAYILDATASPNCTLYPIISWGVFVMALLDKEFAAAGVTMTSWDAFIGTIPYQFYSLLTLAMCGFICLTQLDYGPMLDAQLRAASGKVLRDGAVPLRSDERIELPPGKQPRVRAMAWPLLVLLAVMLAVLIAHGFPFEPLDGVTIRVAIGLGFIGATCLCGYLSIRDGIMSYREAEKTVFKGMGGMAYLCVLMVLAWSLGALCKKLGTAEFLMEVAGGYLKPAILAAVLYGLGCAMSLATGSSWGTYAILMPIGVPLAVQSGASLTVVIAAILNGGLFGDHISPISDTTMLASMGAACDHIDHFRTQWPYALDAALVAGGLYVAAGLEPRAWLVAPGAGLLFCVIYARHRRSLRRLDVRASA